MTISDTYSSCVSALISPYTKVIEKSPVYKTAYDILTQIVLISGNISKNCQTAFGLEGTS